ncbi:helix-turn-helix transcriptional regulator [Actinoplanes couchii]|uniref:Helix-turn-helix transcriptional regulator n=1 Tax=Actinoplanes couchii TaxID=403638 RepID=A0ABQ3XEE3_9ACTN|nr:response regulator transcription factor [Actinoplanes couchii]MDR6319735.1 DNA-binding NarL/FixJ family response regulator [Actinoplanes couchii]GID56869.1 helix-turn-helix transcriptional regulator [Actinoplanes couchii]
MEQVRVVVEAPDPVSRAGLVTLLEATPEIEVLPAGTAGGANVMLVCGEQVTPEVWTLLRRSAAADGPPVVLVVDGITEGELLTAVEYRVATILPRGAVTAERLGHGVLATAAGGGVMPPAMVGELLKHIERVQREVLTPQGLNPSGLTPREVDVLRLMADGMDTQEIAAELCYSERTVKNVIHGITGRLHLRNRSHAVAYALRAGMI